jgi:ubiquinone/menaquinone biosynthesis C-methylase UbiE
MSYDPSAYWSRVADEIRKRGPRNYMAGDDNPFLRYKRRKFLTSFLANIDFRSKAVLEVGCGPGGNLLHVAKSGARRVIGADVSPGMLSLAAQNVGDYPTIELLQTDGRSLRLPDKCVDLAFTVTVLQHDTDAGMFERMVAELCRVTSGTIVLMEDTARTPVDFGPESSFLARSVDLYRAACEKHGFRLSGCQYLRTKASRAVYYRVRSFLSPSGHIEGDPYGALPIAAMKLLLPIARPFDGIFSDDGDLTKMVFTPVLH